MSKFNYVWKLSDGFPQKGVPFHGTTVFSTFACGGGSSMGYKLAGYDVVAANDIDPKMQMVYEKNHKPKQYILDDVRNLIDREDLPEVDLLDASPPCTSFSIAGTWAKDWGVKKKYKEGQKVQTLDDLFFETIKLVEKMQPKVFVGENVERITQGKAMTYTREIVKQLNALGYTTQVFVLNSADMGIPQRRKRAFFIANRLGKKINFKFNEKHVTLREISDEEVKTGYLTEKYQKYWKEAAIEQPVGKFAARRKLSYDNVPRTATASHVNYHPKYPRELTMKEQLKVSSWPEDYDFCGLKPHYVMGMSVPPVMMANVAHEIYEQLLK